MHYPEDCDGLKSETWQFERWKQVPRDLLTPMYIKGAQHFYVDELTATASGKLYIPQMWITRRSKYKRDENGDLMRVLCADALPVTVVNVSFCATCA